MTLAVVLMIVGVVLGFLSMVYAARNISKGVSGFLNGNDTGGSFFQVLKKHSLAAVGSAAGTALFVIGAILLIVALV